MWGGLGIYVCRKMRGRNGNFARSTEIFSCETYGKLTLDVRIDKRFNKGGI